MGPRYNNEAVRGFVQTWTFCPFLLSAMAAVSPAIPAPTTETFKTGEEEVAIAEVQEGLWSFKYLCSFEDCHACPFIRSLVNLLICLRGELLR
jgi:hypothetical protein